MSELRRVSRLLFSFVIVAMFVGAPAHAQIPPWPDGCSVPGAPEWMRRSLDQIFWGACTFHDYCWADCNGPEPPYHDQPWKLGCNAAFYEWMVTACNRRADQETFPIDNLQNRDQFLAFCKDTALAFALAVSTGFAEDAFYDSQCRRGCNPDACSLMGMPLPYACGHGQCYNSPPGSGGGDPGGGSTCDIDGDGWVTPEECVFDCHGYVDGDECRPI